MSPKSSGRAASWRAIGRESLAEEMAEAAKDVQNVADIVERAGLSRVARLRPPGVVKG